MKEVILVTALEHQRSAGVGWVYLKVNQLFSKFKLTHQ